MPRSFPALVLCLLAGCSAVRRPWEEAALPVVVAPEGVRERMVEPVTDREAVPPRAPAPAGDAVPPPPAAEGPPALVLALPDALAFGLQNSPRLRAAYAAIERARGQEQVAFAPFLPQFDLLSHYGATSRALGPAAAGPTGIILGSPTTAHTFAQAELQLQLTVCDFGRTLGRYRQSEGRERIAEQQYVRARETVGFDVAAAYLQALRARAFRVIQEDAIRRAQATLKDTRSRRAAGVADRDDVLRAEVQLSAARDGLDVAQEDEQDALARLNNALGRNATLPLRLVDWQSRPAFDLPLLRCLEVAATQRREIAVAREAVAVAQAGRQAGAADFWPRVYALASVGEITGQGVQRGLQEGAGLHLDVPLYAGGLRQGNLRAAEAEVREAVANAQSVVDGVTLEVTVAHRGVTTSRQRIDRLRPVIAEARENLRLVRNRYRNGNAAPTDLVDAETALTGAQERLASATYDYLAALVRLDYAMGSQQGHLLQAPNAPEAGPPEPDATLPEPRPLPKEK